MHSARLKAFSSFPCGRVKRYENDSVDAVLSLRFQWNKNANFWKRIVDGAWKSVSDDDFTWKPM